MEEQAIIRNILFEIGINDYESEIILKDQIHNLTSDLVIRLKNLLDFSKKQLSEYSYKRYSKFLNDVLKVKRHYIENPSLLSCEESFDESLLPRKTRNNSKIVHGLSLWGLNLRQKGKVSLRNKEIKHIFTVLSSIRQYLLRHVFACIQQRSFQSLQIKRLLKSLIIRLSIRTYNAKKISFYHFSSIQKAPKSISLVIPFTKCEPAIQNFQIWHIFLLIALLTYLIFNQIL